MKQFKITYLIDDTLDEHDKLDLSGVFYVSANNKEEAANWFMDNHSIVQLSNIIIEEEA